MRNQGNRDVLGAAKTEPAGAIQTFSRGSPIAEPAALKAHGVAKSYGAVGGAI